VEIGLLIAAFEGTPLNHEMFGLARDLKRYRSVGIVTDNKADRISHLKAAANLAPLFDPIVVSAEVGSGKDNPRIFEVALDHLGISPFEAVFIDNSPANLVAPDALGMKTIYFDDEANDLRALRKNLGSLGI
jgi:putative hydrolase of the HAD superfamily